MSGILHSVFCSCFANPIVHDNEEDVVNNAWTRVPTIPSKNFNDTPAGTTSQQQQGDRIQPLPDDVDQSNSVFPITWKTSRENSVDLRSIPEVGCIMVKPDEIDQSEIHAYSWNNVNKDDKIW